MAAITVRNLDDHVKQRLRVRAAQHGRSMEAEVRAILVDAVAEEEEPKNILDGCTSGSRARWCRAGHSAAELLAPDRGVRLMIVFDTNVVSELMKASPDEVSGAGLLAHRSYGMYTTAITVAEIRLESTRMPDGRRKMLLSEAAGDAFTQFADDRSCRSTPWPRCSIRGS